MTRLIRIFVCIFSVIGPWLAHADERPAPLQMQFSDKAISVSGLTPGEPAVLFGIARVAEGRPLAIHVERWTEIATDDDRDGVVRVEFAKGVPRQGIWAAVAMNSGAWAMLPTPGYEPARISFSQDLLKNDNAGQLKKIEWPTYEMELLVVRPREGAWRLYAAKFGSFDDDRANKSALRIDVNSLVTIGNASARVNHIKNGDVIVVIDPDWMRYGLLEVGK